MLEKIKLVSIILLLIGSGFLFFSWQSSLEKKTQAENKLFTAQKQIEEMKAYIESREKEVEKLNQELKELVYSKRLKKALASAQGLVSDLHTEIANLKRKNANLSSTNITASNRVKLNSKQLARTIEDLDKSKKKIRELEGQMQKRIRDGRSQAPNKNQAQTVEIETINRQLSDLRVSYLALEKEKGNLERQLDSTTRKLKSQNQSSDLVTTDINKLRRSLEAKNSEIKKLNNNIAKLKSSNDDRGLITLRERLYTQNKEMKKISELYSNLKNKLMEIGDILTEREIEIAGKEKESAQLKGEIAYFRSRLNYREEMSIKNRGHQQELLGELSRVLDINASLQEQLTEVSTFLNTNITTNDSVEILLDTVGLDNRAQSKEFIESRKVKKVLDKDRAWELHSKIQNILEKLDSEKK